MYETIYEIERFPLPSDSIAYLLGTIVLLVFAIGAGEAALETIRKDTIWALKSIKRIGCVLLLAIGFIVFYRYL